MENNNIEVILSPAEKAYLKIKMNVSKYQKKNPEKCKEKNKKWMEKLKQNQEQYDLYLERKRDYYKNIVKPKSQTKKSETEFQTYINDFSSPQCTQKNNE